MSWVTCQICGKRYEYCYACERKKSWRGLADTLDHYYMLVTVMKYMRDGDAASAYESLVRRGVDFSHVSDSGYTDRTRELLREIEQKAAEKQDPDLRQNKTI